jgi:hypothetical protein
VQFSQIDEVTKRGWKIFKGFALVEIQLLEID